MDRTERVELTVCCLIHRNGRYLLQDRKKEDYRGLTLPGGHVEPGESVVDAVIREIKEETGLTVQNPRLRGIKQFPIENGRYLIFLFQADDFSGELVSSEEGEMYWIHESELPDKNTVPDLLQILRVIQEDSLTEFLYQEKEGEWDVVLK